jgi:hypothetical protein
MSLREEVGEALMRRSLADGASLRMWRVAIMVLALLDTGCMAVAAVPLEDPKNILAAKLRAQGCECSRPKSAERDVQASKPDEEVWIVQCENAKYRVRLDQDMAAKVERIN